MRSHATWQVQRTVLGCQDAERRWDTAYQLLLQWARARESARQAQPAPLMQEESHADRAVCAGLDQRPDPDPDH